MKAPASIGLRFRGKTYDKLEEGMRAFEQFVNGRWQEAVIVLKAEMRDYLNNVAEELAERHSGGYPGGTTAKSLSSRTGNSVASILESVSVSGARYDALRGKIGGKYPLMVHEHGATIRSRGRALVIPLPTVLDSKGVPLKRSSSEWENTFVGMSRAGNTLIFQRRATGIVPLYVLKDKVEIPARLGMRETLNEGIPHFIGKAVDRMAAHIMR